MDQLAQHIESIVFVSESPITFKEIKSCLEETFETKFKKPALEKALEELKSKYQEEQFSFEFLEIAGGFQFLTKPAFHNSVGTLLRQNNKRRLSKAALETLSIIAYKQPVVKSEMEKIRGVSCDYSVQKLLEKELIMMVGRSEAPGRPLLYGTSEKFMDYFGLKSLEEMPKPKDFIDPDSAIGEQAPIDESVAAAPISELLADAPPTANEAAIEEGVETEIVGEETPVAEQTQADEETKLVAEETTEVKNEEQVEVPQSIAEEADIEEDAQPVEEPQIAPTTETLSEDSEDYENLATDSEEDIIENLTAEDTTSDEEDE